MTVEKRENKEERRLQSAAKLSRKNEGRPYPHFGDKIFRSQAGLIAMEAEEVGVAIK